MKKIIILSFLIFPILFFTSCGGDDDNEVEEEIDLNVLIDPSDPNAISQVLIFPDNTQTNEGSVPSSSTQPQAPDIDNAIEQILSSNGSTAVINYSYSNVSGNLAGCYVQVDGAGNYFTVPYSESSSTSGSLLLPVGIPVNVDEGQFCINFSIYDNSGLISNVVTTCISVLRLGTGAIQISLSWDNTSDQDLYVTDPEGETIWYQHESSISGGQLDRDDVDGFGPENIYWLDNAPDGEYIVKVNDYSGTSSPTSFFVTVSGPNTSRNFNGATVGGSTADVVTFSKNGSDISF